jgi:hypothetical protein
MHGEAVGVGEHGLGVTPSVALAYRLFVPFLMGYARCAALEPRAEGAAAGDGAPAHATPTE